VRPDTLKVEEKKDEHGDIVREHPSFAVIGASRVSGRATLTGSPLRHNGYITIRISYAKEVVSHTHSSFFPHSRASACIAEVALSEAQWAAFVSTLNVGSGVPCTVEYAKTGVVRRHPYIEDASFDERREADIRRHTAKAQEQLKKAVNALDELLKEKTISKKRLAEVRSMFTQPVDHGPSNMEHLANMLIEHKDNLLESAKAEVASMVTRMHMEFPQTARTGIEFEDSAEKEDVARLEYTKETIDKHS
jgi:hypothetical protein